MTGSCLIQIRINTNEVLRRMRQPKQEDPNVKKQCSARDKPGISHCSVTGEAEAKEDTRTHTQTHANTQRQTQPKHVQTCTSTELRGNTNWGSSRRRCAEYWQEIPPPWCQHTQGHNHANLAHTLEVIAQLIGSEAAGNGQSASNNMWW